VPDAYGTSDMIPKLHAAISVTCAHTVPNRWRAHAKYILCHIVVCVRHLCSNVYCVMCIVYRVSCNVYRVICIVYRVMCIV